jgi:FkbM family methyltransferase
MPHAQNWVGTLFLHLPARLRCLRDVPLMGNLIHRLSHRILPMDQKVWARVQSGPSQGLWLELNPRTGYSYVRGGAEPAVQAALVERLRPGMVFYDLGANIGLFTLLGARLVGDTGKVFSFEPDPASLVRLRRNIRRNGFKNIVVVESGIWSCAGNMHFVTSERASPDHGIGKFVEHGAQQSGTLTPCVSLDDFIQNAPPPDAIKCDIEGAEIEALRGATSLLQSPHRPWFICETHSAASGQTVREILGRYGYHLKTADELHVLAVPARD